MVCALAGAFTFVHVIEAFAFDYNDLIVVSVQFSSPFLVNIRVMALPPFPSQRTAAGDLDLISSCPRFLLGSRPSKTPGLSSRRLNDPSLSIQFEGGSLDCAIWHVQQLRQLPVARRFLGNDAEDFLVHEGLLHE
jgi:hypothetical protein